MRTSELSARQLSDITVIERVASIFSLLGCLWIAITFLGSHSFRKPINRLVFYASVGNIFTNAATIMSRDFLHDPRGAGCQVQAFFIQMFMPADAVWTLAMAANVWLTFYHKYDSEQLRSLEKWYILLCYGIPFIPALIFIFVTGDVKGRVYGNATLWCWIASDWEILRIACFYGPVWLVILATITIYLRAGKDIYAKRQQLRAFHDPMLDTLPTVIDPFTSCRTTEVVITSETVTSTDAIDLQQLPLRPGQARASISKANQSYQVTVTSQNPGGSSQEPRWPDLEKKTQSPNQQTTSNNATTRDFNVPITQQMSNGAPPMRRYILEANTAAWSYTKVAVLFFLAMMITWIPSSANRVYSVVHPGHISLPLQFASAFVLPLQGFWNALIYTTTSLPACRQLWRQVRERSILRGTSFKSMTHAFGDNGDREAWPKRLTMRSGSQKLSLEESESMTELQASRPVTKDTSSR